jgi:hypothetical protein
MGDIGADGDGVIEYKNSYIDFNVGAWNAKVGVHSATLGRAFLFADDFSGITATYKGDGFSLPIYWIKENEGGMGADANDDDRDMYGLFPSFTAGGMNLTPYVLYVTEETDSYSVFYAGLDLDKKFDSTSLWVSAIMRSGDDDNVDYSGSLVAVGANTDLGGTDVHGQVFYVTGDEDLTDTDDEAFIGPTGNSYYWSEIMGYGSIDNQVSAGSPADHVTNIMAANIGVTHPMDKWKLSLDLWYAALIEDDANGNTDLGIEIDLKASYKVVENLNLDLIVAYLSAGDATVLAPSTENDGNPMEIGAVLSLSF